MSNDFKMSMSTLVRQLLDFDINKVRRVANLDYFVDAGMGDLVGYMFDDIAGYVEYMIYEICRSNGYRHFIEIQILKIQETREDPKDWIFDYLKEEFEELKFTYLGAFTDRPDDTDLVGIFGFPQGRLPCFYGEKTLMDEFYQGRLCFKVTNDADWLVFDFNGFGGIQHGK